MFEQNYGGDGGNIICASVVMALEVHYLRENMMKVYKWNNEAKKTKTKMKKNKNRNKTKT